MQIIKLLIFLTFICFLPLEAKSKPIVMNSPYAYDLLELRSEFNKKMAQKYGLKYIGFKEKVKGTIRHIGVRFQLYVPLSKNEARVMVVDCVQELLNEINNNKKMYYCLDVYPFTPKQVDIIIFINTPNKNKYYHPDLSVVAAYNGIIDYSTNNPEDKAAYKVVEEESFEDAVKMLKGEMEIPPSQIK